VASCLRGGYPASVQVEIVDGHRFVEQKVNESVLSPKSDDERDLRRGLALLRLTLASDDTAEAVRDYWNSVAAFYSWDQNNVTVLDRGERVDAPSSVVLLLHEMVHAMQHHELDAIFKQNRNTFDEALALAGAVEGEAVLYQDLATLFGFGRNPDDTDFARIFAQYEAREWRDARTDRSPYDVGYLRFSYAFGGAYLNRAWRGGANPGVRDVFAALPSSTRQLLAGYQAPVPSGSGWSDPPNDLGTPAMPPAFEQVAILHLGVWLFEIWQDLSRGSTRDFKGFSDSGLAGDVLNVFRTPTTGDVTSVWRLRFEDPTQAATLVSSIVDDPSLAASQDGSDVIIIASTQAGVGQALIGSLTWSASTDSDSVGSMRASPAPESVRLVVCPKLP
jgi:hypothetical protein